MVEVLRALWPCIRCWLSGTCPCWARTLSQSVHIQAATTEAHTPGAGKTVEPDWRCAPVGVAWAGGRRGARPSACGRGGLGLQIGTRPAGKVLGRRGCCDWACFFFSCPSWDLPGSRNRESRLSAGKCTAAHLGWVVGGRPKKKFRRVTGGASSNQPNRDQRLSGQRRPQATTPPPAWEALGLFSGRPGLQLPKMPAKPERDDQHRPLGHFDQATQA